MGNAQCRAFTFNANPMIRSGVNCFLKGGVDRLEAYSTAIGGLSFVAPGETVPQYTFDAIDPTRDLSVNRDYPGNDLSTIPTHSRGRSTTAMACVNDRQCQAFGYVTSLKQCWLKGAVGSESFARGIVSGTKRTVSIDAQTVVNVPP